ncbi:MAG: NAD(P)H-hydrate epimerase [Eggerthellaceae bacterium]
MNVYLYDIQQAIFWFPLLAAIVTLPYLIYQYRSYGSVPWVRSAFVYAFIFYLLCAYYLVILPLPLDHNTYVAYAASPQLVPFNFVIEFLAQTSFVAGDPSTWLSVLGDPYIYEAVFNVLLVVPLGMFLRYYFHCRWWQCLLAGFGMTLFFEVSQITGLFGLYAHPYRLFDVDDLLLNTLGALVGFWLTGPLLRFLPDIHHLNEEARIGGIYASFTRRGVALILDVACSVACFIFVLLIAGLAGAPFEDMLARDLARFAANMVGALSAVYALFFLIMPCLLRGQTLGHKIVKLHIVHPDASGAHFYNYLVRYGLLYLFLAAPAWCMIAVSSPTLAGTSDQTSVLAYFASHRETLALIFAATYALWFMSIVVRALRSNPQRPFAMLNGVLSNTRIMTETAIEQAASRDIVLDVAEVGRLERMIEADGTPMAQLMASAGHAVTATVRRIYPEAQAVVVLCGTGNNGGDGWVCAGDLADVGYPVTLISPRIAEAVEAEPARSCALSVFGQAARDKAPLRVLIDPDLELLAEIINDSEIIIDALLGTGFSGENMREPMDAWVRLANEARRTHEDTRIIAIDVPSGLCAQTGHAAIPCIEADYTVTMLAYKPGLLVEDAQAFCGTTSLARIAEVKPYLGRLDLVATIPHI